MPSLNLSYGQLRCSPFKLADHRAGVVRADGASARKELFRPTSSVSSSMSKQKDRSGTPVEQANAANDEDGDENMSPSTDDQELADRLQKFQVTLNDTIMDSSILGKRTANDTDEHAPPPTLPVVLTGDGNQSSTPLKRQRGKMSPGVNIAFLQMEGNDMVREDDKEATDPGALGHLTGMLDASRQEQ